MAKKQYVRGSAKKFDFANGGSVLNMSFNVEQLAELADENGWIRLVASERTETDDYGNTHSIYLNDWKPEPKGEAKKAKPAAKAEGEDEEDLPF